MIRRLPLQSRPIGRAVLRLAALCAVLVVAGCGSGASRSQLAPPPNLVALEGGVAYPAAQVPTPLRTARSEILYATDRNPTRAASGAVTGYGEARSKQMAYGASLVAFGDLQSWDELVALSSGVAPDETIDLDSVAIREISRFPATPLPYLEGGGRLQTTPEAAATYDASVRAMRNDLSRRLRETGLNRVTVYVHGFNNDFDDAVGTMANIWHYSGRQSLPVLYSWPAGNTGPLAYFRDTESGEFSVFHLKEFMRVLASVPEVARIDVIAHSRGTVVTTVALRELLLEARGAGQDVRARLKTGTLVLAAADLDVSVSQQRLVAERFGNAFEQINIYVNPNDGALFLSGLIGAFDRVGGISLNKLTEADRREIAESGNVNVIIVERGSQSLGHTYFRDNPAVMSDIILALWTSAPAGSAARPLRLISPNLYALPPDYPGDVSRVIRSLGRGT
ncbi:MAG: alpha/beta hydrolase [Pseudomonadota bacterium]